MDFFERQSVRLAFVTEGTGRPMVLVHGFASTHRANWVNPGWVEPLVESGRQVIMLDVRGHGQSGAPHDAAAYEMPEMVGDVIGLLDHLSIPVADVMGYSMGAMICLHLGMAAGDRVRSLVAAGVGGSFLGDPGDPAPVVEALRADGLTADPVGRAFRRFAEANDQDLEALALCYGRVRTPLTTAMLADITTPTLVVAGDQDVVAGDPAGLAVAIPRGRAVSVPRRDHMRTVGDPAYKAAVLEFLASLD